MNAGEFRADLLCVCPHSDDAEIALGGTLRLLADRGREVWVADLTRGELGSNGTPEERWGEAVAAGRELGLAGRLQLDLPDGFISAVDPAQVAAVVAVIRSLKPRWLVSAPMGRRHPDHLAIHPLVEKAAFMARLAAYEPAMPPARISPDYARLPDPVERWNCEAVLHVCPPREDPAVIFDVSGTWAAKRASLACYESQFEAERGGRTTMINSPEFMREVERWGRSWGFRAGVEYAEALGGAAAPLLCDLPSEVWK